jgi:hypothetical protein
LAAVLVLPLLLAGALDAEDVEDLPVMATSSDEATEDRQEGEARHADPVRPR